MYNRLTFNTRKQRQRRTGASAVEAVLVAPLLVLILLGAIDIGQYVHVAQTVSNASRETARFAARHTTDRVSEVENYACDYLHNAFPRLSRKEIEDAVEVSVGNVANNSDVYEFLEAVPSGGTMPVTVEFNFQTVRWLKNIDYWDLEQGGVTTVIRRE